MLIQERRGEWYHVTTDDGQRYWRRTVGPVLLSIRTSPTDAEDPWWGYTGHLIESDGLHGAAKWQNVAQFNASGDGRCTLDDAFATMEGRARDALEEAMRAIPEQFAPSVS